ncbi:MAG: protein TolR [Sphingopyxis sp.]|jgi:biopolymer transport protein TolR|uniref:protein TolR n=1 Tax=unclassified Sphingopyxis TaxID=2614943 RepID=UPI00072FA650|nr:MULTISPECIES: protein TolR [unclassified Sphingopyxis]KTE01210.1 protein TolR [Sphingopyxis sp. H012]KTE04978.1 protein TolR [Sphingopyxis sp. H093]KTE12560.1 protein TolR [Sphingopyxis sp. H053]KTE26776.1 protein TolR [Sphingopyxis sp. H080]KTE34750.1 protein TolR [Sphingopyxis sp. H038]
MAMSGPSGGIGGRRGRGHRRAPMAEINVTPLVDVMLVLLIIFMITAPLLASAVPIDLPESRAKPVETEDQEPVQLSINADDTLYIGEEVVPEAELPARLDAIARENEGKDKPRQIMLRADKGLDYGRVMRVMGELNRAGLTRISLVTTGSEGAAEGEPAAVTDGSETRP